MIIAKNKIVVIRESIVFLVLMLLFALIWSGNVSSSLFKEDGIIEYLSAFFWLIGFLISVFHLFSKKSRHKLLIGIFCLICFISLGEEISWGQRIFDIKTPDIFAKGNTQKEMNLHNLEVFWGGSVWRNFFKTGELSYRNFTDSQNLFRIGFVVYFLIFPFLNKKCNLTSRVGYYKPKLLFFITVWVVILFSFLVSINASQSICRKIQELREMCYALFVAIYLYDLVRLCRIQDT